MALDTIRVSLGSLIVLIFISCTNGKRQETNTVNTAKIQKDTCQLDLGATESIELHVGCGNCHTYDTKRQFPEVPTYSEIAEIDSSRLVDFVFKTRHNGYFLKDTILLNHNNRALDTLDDCEKKNLVHFIKSNNRRIPQVLKLPKLTQ